MDRGISLLLRWYHCRHVALDVLELWCGTCAGLQLAGKHRYVERNPSLGHHLLHIHQISRRIENSRHQPRRSGLQITIPTVSVLDLFCVLHCCHPYQRVLRFQAMGHQHLHHVLYWHSVSLM